MLGAEDKAEYQKVNASIFSQSYHKGFRNAITYPEKNCFDNRDHAMPSSVNLGRHLNNAKQDRYRAAKVSHYKC